MQSSDRVKIISLNIQQQINDMLDNLENKPWPVVAQIDDQLSFGMRIQGEDEFRIQLEVIKHPEEQFSVSIAAWFIIPERQFPDSQIFALPVPQGRIYNSSYLIEEVESEEDLYNGLYNVIREFVPEAITNILD